MFGLQDIRKSKVWQEAYKEGMQKCVEKGMEKGKSLARQKLIQKCLAKGMSLKEITDLLEISLTEARKLAKAAAM